VAAAPAARAENSLRANEFGVSGEIADSTIVLSGRYLLQNTLAVLARVGFQHVSVDNGDDHSGTDYRLGAGLRKYVTEADLAPMVGVDVDIVQEYDGLSDEDADGFELAGYIGAEYFLHRRVSVEGRVGLAIATRDNGADVMSLGTFTSGVGVTAYFP
jgi:hypothetical protein